MVPHLKKGLLLLPHLPRRKEAPMEAQKEASLIDIIARNIRTVSPEIHRKVVNILGETIYDLHKDGLLAHIEKSAKDILNDHKEG